MFNTRKQEIALITGRKMASYLRSRLRVKGIATQNIESICLYSCGLDYNPPGESVSETFSQPSFAEAFTSQAKDLFPGLQSVVASPYDLMTGYKKGDSEAMYIGLKKVATKSSSVQEVIPYMSVKASDIYTGNLPPKLFESLKPDNICCGRNRSTTYRLYH